MSRNLSSAYHVLFTASLTTGATDLLFFNLNYICHLINNSGAVQEDNISMTTEEIAILFKVNIAKQLSLPNRIPVLLLEYLRKSSPNSYPPIILKSKILPLEMFYKAF